MISTESQKVRRFRWVLEMERQDMSQWAVCRGTGIDPATLSRLRRGLIPAYPGWRRKLSEFFGMSEEALFEEV